MTAGRWVFPITILGFFVFLTFWLVANPAEPAPVGAEKRLWRVEAGDNVTYEVTIFYNASNGYIAQTTLEELQVSGVLDRQPFEVAFDGDPVTRVLPATLTPETPHPLASLLGRKIGESFETIPFPNFFGMWRETRTLDTTVVELAYNRTLTGPLFAAFLGSGQTALGHAVATGDEFRCEQDLPYVCRVLDLDPGAQMVSYRRIVPDGDVLTRDTFPAFREVFAPDTPVPSFRLVARGVDAETFELSWQLRPGDAFTLVQPFGEFGPGSYRALSADDGSVTARYAPHPQLGPVAAHLVGEVIWFEFTVVDIDRL